MASLNQRRRDPLLDSNMQAAIERRGKELIGLVLITLGVMAALMIGSYTPDDPNWMVSTDAPVQNLMGRLGAAIAAPLFMIIGWGSWSIALILVVWGGRLALHRGEERAVGRLIFAPIAVALTSIYAATLVPGQDWISVHSFGLGGLFGETVMGALLTLLPLSPVVGINILSAVLALAMLAMVGFVLGFTKPEVMRLARFMMIGVVMIYAGLVAILATAAGKTVSTAQTLNERRTERREARAALDQSQYASEPKVHAEPPLRRVAPPVMAGSSALAAETMVPEQPTKPGLLASLIRRPEPMPDPELIETPAYEGLDVEAPGEERIRAKIADVIKSRVRQAPVRAPGLVADAPLTRGLGRGPDPLIYRAPDALPPEPPLTAADRAPQMRAEPPLRAAPQPIPQPEAEAQALPLEQPVAPSQAIPVAEPRKVVQNLQRKAPAPSRRAQAEAQPALAFEDTHAEFELPPLNLLESPTQIQRHHLSDEALEENARMLESVLDDYGVKGEIVSVRPGPVVTMYELEPAPGLKASRVIGLADDIARSMAALSARVSTVPGRSVIGIELPNEHREKVVLREILASRDFGDSNMRLPLALGKDIGGDPIVANLAKMPHLLIAGTTGSGKSVAINTMILSLLYKLTPQECRLIMIDPKMLELSVYDGIPHLLSPVVTDPKKAVVALKWVVGEMEDRYRRMSKMGVRNIEGHNGRVREALAKGELFSRTVQTGFDDETGEPVFETEETVPEVLPYIVVIVDEMADLMMVAGKEIEACIQRLAQMARASGIHLIMATQRPSVDVITGTIKANFPTRISFQVTSKIDSRTILGEMGAEQLLGMGDMLYMAGGAKITRCHGPFVSDEEVEEVVNHLKGFGPPAYIGGVVEGPDESKENDIDLVLGLGGNTDSEDALYDTAVQIVIKDRKCSTSYIQRKLAIGYNKAARLVEQMEEEGLVSPANHVGKREILVPEQ
ncbi:MAG: DNA translocase FtsK [Aestuariivita sp.]|uniref:DNA translocase FtsK 4TM domain-containing protein n=1 Tax=Aestuariivita sp. TaxID=1872407 RepID=UPI003BB0644F